MPQRSIRRCFLLICSLLFVLNLNAQTSSGTEFWCVFGENLDELFNDDPKHSFSIFGELAASGFIQVPATGFEIPFSSLPNQAIQIDLPDAQWYALGSESIENKGIRIISDNPIRVTAIHYRQFFTESSIVLPVEELGTNYLPTCVFDTEEQSGDPSQIVLVSTEDANEIEIIPAALTFGLQAAGVPFTVTLDEGQSFQIQSGGDLTSTVVRSLSDKNIAVFSGAKHANVGPCNANSHIWDQCFPIEQWGLEYYYVPFSNYSAEVKIVALEDNTTVFCDCDELVTLNAGESYIDEYMVAKIFSATAPISVAQLKLGEDCDFSGIGDPNMLNLLPTNYQIQNVAFNATDDENGMTNNYFSEHYINVVARTDEVTSINLNGIAFAANEFTIFEANPAYSYISKSLSAGLHNLSSSNSFWAVSYGFGFVDSYTHSLGYAEVNDLLDFELDVFTNDQLCPNSILAFESNLAESPSGAQNVNWIFSDGQMSSEWSPELSFFEGNYSGIFSFELGGCIYSDTLEFIIDVCVGGSCDNLEPVAIDVMGSLCVDSVLTFTATTLALLDEYDWMIDGTTENSSDVDYSFSNPDNYLVQLIAQDANNCVYMAQLDVSIDDCFDPCANPAPIQIQVSNATDCVDSTFVFSFPNLDLVNVEWITPFESSSDNEFSTSFPMEGNFTIDLLAGDGNGCNVSGSVSVSISDCSPDCNNVDPISIQFTTTADCVDSAFVFSFPNPDLTNVQWISPFDSGSDDLFSTSFPMEGNFTIDVSAVDGNGCDVNGSAAVLISTCDPGCDSIDPIPILFSSVADCVDSNFVFFFSDPNLTNVQWNSPFDSSNDNAFDTSFPMEGDFTIDLTAVNADGCDVSGTLTLSIPNCDTNCSDLDPIAIQFILSQNCVDSTLIFTFAETDLTDVQWQSPFDQSTEQEFSTSFPEEGDFAVMLSALNSEGCPVSGSLDISIGICNTDDCENVPDVILQFDEPVCLDSTTIFSFEADEELSNIQWISSDGQSGTATDFEFVGLNTGNVELDFTALRNDGCFVLTSIDFTVENCAFNDCSLLFPQAFSPNNDGNNDLFGAINSCDLESFDMKVYNRWGNLVFQSADVFTRWDGLNEGSLSSLGVYLFTVRYQLTGSEELIEKYGDVTLIR